jgi:hypothetical protein
MAIIPEHRRNMANWAIHIGQKISLARALYPATKPGKKNGG